jgi:hypothetical protein
MEIITGRALRDYFMEHVKETAQCCFYTVRQPLPVFKKAMVFDDLRIRAIVNLLVPVGATVFADSQAFDRVSGRTQRKMRASAASVHSIATLDGRPMSRAVSWYDPGFHYIPGDKLAPRLQFCQLEERCGSGIHFFLNVRDALEYSL